MSDNGIFQFGDPSNISDANVNQVAGQLESLAVGSSSPYYSSYLDSEHAIIEEAKELNRIIFVYNHTSEQTCNICLSQIVKKNAEITPCGHVFHAKCLMKWKNRRNKNTCPVCRGQLREVSDDDAEEVNIESQLLRLELNDLLQAQFLRLPAAPFAIPLTNAVSVTFCFDIVPNNCSMEVLTQLAEWIHIMGIRVTSVDQMELAIRTSGSSSMQRRPGGMEILTFEEIQDDIDVLGETISISYVGIAAPDRVAHGRDVLSNLSPFQPGIPLATISTTSQNEPVTFNHIAQAGCLLLSCDPELLTRHFYTGNGLGFGNPTQSATDFPDTVTANRQVSFQIQQLLTCLEGAAAL